MADPVAGGTASLSVRVAQRLQRFLIRIEKPELEPDAAVDESRKFLSNR